MKIALRIFLTEMVIYTYSRTDLQGMKAKHHKEMISQYIEYNITNYILNKAKEGKTQYFWTDPVPRNHIGGHPNQAHAPFTNEEIIEALKEKFPDTTVEYQETWIETRPGVKEERKGIVIDWS